MNSNATIGTNDPNTNNVNTTGLNSAGNDLLQAIAGGGLLSLEVVAAAGDTFPPLKAAVVEALAIIGIVKVGVFISNFHHVYLCDGIRNSRTTRKIGLLFLTVSLRRLRRLFRLPVNITRVTFHRLCNPIFRI